MTLSIIEVLVILIVCFVAIPIGGLFTFSPKTIIRWQAQFYRKTNSLLGSTNQEVDHKFQFPWDSRLMGRRSDFAERGANDPESFKDLALLYRVFGILILALIGFAITLAVLFLVIIPVIIP